MRLEDLQAILLRLLCNVSIPYWCDWKLYIYGIKSPRSWFQFLIGAIGSADGVGGYLSGFRFNSLLVRLEGQFTFSYPPGLDCFNSLLVRLEGDERAACNISNDVSIPYWCDWKNYRPNGILLNTLFQFLIGAIGSGTGTKVRVPQGLFQFLIGAIGSAAGAGKTYSLLLFQFLIGAIGRLDLVD